MKKSQMTFFLLIGLFITFGLLWAQSPEPVLKYRQMGMKNLGGHMGAIGSIMKHRLPYTKHIVEHARALHATSKTVLDSFPKGSHKGLTDAKPKIWQQWNKFKSAAQKLEQESAKLVKVAEAGNMQAIGAQMKKVGGSCKNCHKPYRKGKKNSYKKR